MASANFTVNATSVPPAVAVSASSTVTLALVSTVGVRNIAWSIIGNHAAAASNPTITPAGSPSGATASFVMPSGAGQAYIVQCVINGGVDETGQAVTNYTKTAKVGVNNSNTRLPFALGETTESSATHGIIEDLNEISDGAGGGGGGVTDHGALTGLNDDDHSAIYELWARPVVAYTGAASTAVLADARKHITTSHGSANTFTIPPNASVAYSTGTLLVGVNIGAGTMTLTPGAGVTLSSLSLSVPQYAWWWAKKTDTNGWYCSVVGSSSASSGGLGGDAHKFTFSTTTTDSDPGAGTLRFNNATPASVTQLFVDDADYATTDIQTWLASLVVTIGAIKGRVTVQSISDPTKKLVYNLTAWTTATGYKKLTVAHVSGTALPTTTAGDTVLSFDALGMGQTIVAGDIASDAVTTAKILDANVTYAKIQNGNGLTIVGRAAASTGANGDITYDNNGEFILRRSSVLISAKAIDENIDAAAAIAGSKISPTFTAKTAVTAAVETTGSPYAFRLTAAAHTTLTASVEVVDADFALNRTVQLATGALTTQRAALFRAPTYGFVGASVVTDAATLAITGAPIAGTNATITNAYAFWVQAGAVRLQALGAGLVKASATGVLSSAAFALSDLPTGTAGQWLTCDSTGAVIASDIALSSKTISYSAADAVGAGITTRKSRGSSGSPAAHNAEDVLAFWTGQGRDASAYFDAGKIQWVAEQAGGTGKRTRAESYLHDGTSLVKTGSAVRTGATTTDATLTTVYSIAVAADQTLKINMLWHGDQSSSSNIAHRETSLTVRRSGSGNIVEIGHTDGISLFKDDATWGTDTQIGYALDNVGFDVDITVLGKAATTIAWTLEISWSVF